MHKKGFTLIELLAVIVILAIIALITMPMITGIVAKAKKGGAESSALGWIDAVEKQVMLNQLNSENEIDSNETYSVLELKDKGVKVKGQSPNSGYMSLEEGKIAHADLCIGEYRVIIENDKIVDTVKDNDCKLELEPGLYDKNNNLVLSWDELESKYNFDVEEDYSDVEFVGSGSLATILAKWSNDTRNDYKQIKKVVIPFEKEVIGTNAFQGCDFLTNIIIPSTIYIIKAKAFADCKNLKNITIPYGVMKIDSGAFENCINIKNIVLPDSVENIGFGVFAYCSSLTNVTISSGLSYLANRMFEDCINLKNVIIPNNINRIEEYAFSGCKNITGINISENVAIINRGAFAGCTKLAKIEVEKNNNYYTSVNGVLYNKNKTKIIAFPGGKQGSFTIPSSVIDIEYDAFYGCIGLTRIDVDKNNQKYSSIDGIVYDKNKKTLYICPQGRKESVVIPNTVTEIERYSFENCIYIKSIVLPNNIKTIQYEVFKDCISLTSITIPASVTYIYETAFDGCTNLTRIDVNENNQKYSSIDGIVYDNNGKILYLCPRGMKGSVVIPNGATTISSKSFNDCKKITSITIPSSVTEISFMAFYNCTSLTSIDIPNTVKTIGSGAFSNCTNLTSITIPSGITVIEYDIFANCTSLVSIAIPSSVTEISWSAFEGCTSLISITIPSSVTEIKSYAFENCINLNNVIFETKSGWYIVKKDYSDEILFKDSINVNDSAVNANNIKDTYLEYDWER